VSKSGSGAMTAGGEGADVHICDQDGVKRYWVTKQSTPEDGVEVAGATCTQVDGTTEMVVTRTLAAGARRSGKEREITPGTPQTITWARGGDGETSLVNQHETRGFAEVDLGNIAGGVTSKKSSAQWTLWLHLLFMAPAWGAILPMGAAIANRCKAVQGAPKGKWFQLHRAFQSIGWTLQLLGFIFAVVHCEKYSKHFNYLHTIIGMVVVAIGTLQPLNAIVRPHPPEGGWPEGGKPAARTAWEAVHKGLGWLAIILGMVNVILGVLLAQHLDFEAGPWVVGLVIGLIGIVAFVGYTGLSLANPDNAFSKALTGARPGSGDTEMMAHATSDPAAKLEGAPSVTEMPAQ